VARPTGCVRRSVFSWTETVAVVADIVVPFGCGGGAFGAAHHHNECSPRNRHRPRKEFFVHQTWGNAKISWRAKRQTSQHQEISDRLPAA